MEWLFYVRKCSIELIINEMKLVIRGLLSRFKIYIFADVSQGLALGAPSIEKISTLPIYLGTS